MYSVYILNQDGKPLMPTRRFGKFSDYLTMQKALSVSPRIEVNVKAYPAYLVEHHKSGTIYLSQEPKTPYCEVCGDQDKVIDFVKHPAEALHVIIRYQADYTDSEGLNTSEGFKDNVRELTGYDYTFELRPVYTPLGYTSCVKIPSFYKQFPESN